jgi:ribonuclease R
VQVRARFRPHHRGFGFLAPVADGGDAAGAGDPGPAAARSGRVFVPPALARTLVADDLVDATVAAGDKGDHAEDVTLVERPRRLAVGRVQRRGSQLVLMPEPAFSSGWIPLTGVLGDALGQALGHQAVVLIDGGEGGAAARALVAGPYADGSPDAVRARAVVLVLGGAAPSLVPGGPAAVGLDVGATELAHVRLMGQLAGGRRGAAAGLDRAGPVPGAHLEAADRRDEPCVTVDAVSSRELDDAVAARWDGDPQAPVHVAVHITDVAGVVGCGSAADAYARTVAATTYLASGPSAPMLDPEVSEAARSLLHGQDRPVLSVRMAVLPDGSVADVTLEPALIRSRARLSYGALEQWLAGDARQLRTQARTQEAAAEAVVGAALEAARRLGVERDARMTLTELFDQPDLVPTVSGGRITVGLAEPHAEAYRLIERLMVAANEAVGGWLAARGVPALYRAHAGIDPQQGRRLLAAAELAGATLPALAGATGDPDRVTAEILAELDRLAAEQRTADRDLLIAAATTSTARAAYDPDPSHHRGLGASAYCHFTSPLRRYADLVVHRQLRAALADEPPPHDLDELRALSGWLGARAGALSRLEARERADLWSRALADGELEGVETATVTGIIRAGLRIRLPRLGLTGFVPAAAVTEPAQDGRAALDSDEHGLASPDGPWRVGLRLPVRFTGLDELGRADWAPAGPPSGAGAGHGA